MSSQEILKVEDLFRSYFIKNASEDQNSEIKVLKGLNFTVEEGEFVGVMGKSGCGKTTLLKVLGLIDHPTKGKMYFGGTGIDELWGEQLADIRRREMGFVFQDFYLMDSLSVRENIMLPLVLDKIPSKDCIQRSDELAAKFEISQLLEKKPFELSGGEKQRVAICRALINNPDLILADEPTGNLDSRSGQIVIDTLTQINRVDKKTIVMVTHDPQIASYCSKIILLKDGNIQDIMMAGEDRNEFYQRIVNQMVNL